MQYYPWGTGDFRDEFIRALSKRSEIFSLCIHFMAKNGKTVDE